MPAGTTALPALDGELPIALALAASRLELPGALAAAALFDNRGLEVPGSLAMLAYPALDLPSLLASETGLRGTADLARSVAVVALPDVLAGSATRPAFQRPFAGSFTAKTRPIVVDWADQVLPNRRRFVLVALGSRLGVLPEQKFEHAHLPSPLSSSPL